MANNKVYYYVSAAEEDDFIDDDDCESEDGHLYDYESAGRNVRDGEHQRKDAYPADTIAALGSLFRMPPPPPPPPPPASTERSTQMKPVGQNLLAPPQSYSVTKPQKKSNVPEKKIFGDGWARTKTNATTTGASKREALTTKSANNVPHTPTSNRLTNAVASTVSTPVGQENGSHLEGILHDYASIISQHLRKAGFKTPKKVLIAPRKPDLSVWLQTLYLSRPRIIPYNMYNNEDSYGDDSSSSDEAEFTSDEKSDSDSDGELYETLEDDPVPAEMHDFVEFDGRSVIWGRKTFKAPDGLLYLQTEQEISSIQDSVERQRAAEMPPPFRPTKSSPQDEARKQTRTNRRAMAKEAQLYRMTQEVRLKHPRRTSTPTTPMRSRQHSSVNLTRMATPTRCGHIKASTAPISVIPYRLTRSNMKTPRQPTGLVTPAKQAIDYASQCSGSSERRQKRMLERLQWDSD
ncbi:hypothetical protein CC86DRAFT_413508 [Ophiobolus disseminans]|uniref:Uncharacterized protein n=1 Tax=Ophiobolus disseminans TaxID=1469910 RepID=A0A6A6ZCZ1_9PLEO|nr:hypothetical protein CC86DRAFT_413508 [Ophiobolus disseminans]